MLKRLSLVVTIFLFSTGLANAQTWVDSLDRYAREEYMPAGKYVWTWQRASLLRAMVMQHETRPAGEKEIYLDYVRRAMEATTKRAHGKRPNAVASGHGMAFLWRITGEEKYKTIADRIYNDFLNIIRVPGGGVSHKMKWLELWDDTIYMIGVFLLEMYRASGDEVYLDHLVEEIRIHREKLMVEQWGLWVHGWDANNKDRLCLCGQRKWADSETRRSHEIWGRGNGWVIVTLSDALKTIPREHPHWKLLSSYLQEMIAHLPGLQDENTGHWYQLPVRPNDEENWIESSCTAMFAYGILTALQNGLVDDGDQLYRRSVDLAYTGLRHHSIHELEGPHLTTKNVCKGTCTGDKQYYYNRKSVHGKHFGLAMFITFGIHYELDKGWRNGGFKRYN